MLTLAYISAVSILLPLIIALLRFRYASFVLKIFCYYIFLCAVTETIATYLGYHKLSNNEVANIFYLSEGLGLIYFFYILYNQKKYSLPLLMMATGFTTIAMYTFFVNPGFSQYNSYLRTSESIMLQILSGYALLRISKFDNVELTSNPLFWVSGGLFIYFSVNVVVFFSATFIFNENTLIMRQVFFIHSIINIIANIIFTKGLTCISRSPSSPR